jgi:hypothetical protein
MVNRGGVGCGDGKNASTPFGAKCRCGGCAQRGVCECEGVDTEERFVEEF